jgi:acyl transferase domain-containing protein
MSNADISNDSNGSEIAVIGMAGRFPGAATIAQFWRNLREGLESISFFTEQEMESSVIDRPPTSDPHYVRARAVLEGIELFDAGFFGFNPREAESIDPQHRLFLECAWEALEGGGYDAERYSGRIGVFGGVSMNTYLLNNLYGNRAFLESVDPYQLVIGNDKDFLTTRASYKLNLRGPSATVQTACSTSLVAVHLACQSLLGGESDMALAGGVSVRVPQRIGYQYQEGGILSPDGHCRPFDHRARGTIGGSGVGVVLLKRLADALAAGDHVHAVIKGSAINNDGSMKVGYTAPSVEAQAEVIAEAQFVAGIEADSIGYVEAHGTATALGDPIEVEALTQAFRQSTERKRYCALGSVKSNVGHLDAAAGVTGLIKAVLALKHKEIPASLHFEEPNPKIDFSSSPFYVNARLSPWEAGDGAPRRAGVNSFGIGGTNAHVILEEAPQQQSSREERPFHLLLLSARTETALEAATERLANHLKEHPRASLADVAYTLQVGRRQFNHRRTLVCRDVEQATSALTAPAAAQVQTGVRKSSGQPVMFMFPGQGTQQVNMGRSLYETEPVFRAEVDACAEALKADLGLDLRDVLYPRAEELEEAAHRLNQTELTQPALFVVEYALSRLWMEWGVRPEAMIGHSIGEYVAACLAGVFSREDALRVVAARARLMQQLPGGAMLAVALSEETLAKRLDGQLSLAAVNGRALCVVAGPVEEIGQLQSTLTAEGTGARLLRTSHAFHSGMMTDAVEHFRAEVERVGLQAPRLRFVSNVTGRFITAEEATDPGYWAQHMLHTVRFYDGIQELLREGEQVLLEVGPGQTLGNLVRPSASRERQVVVSSLPKQPQQAEEQAPDMASVLNALGQLWLAGINPDWEAFYAGQRRLRTELPTYPFERQRYWIEPAPFSGPGLQSEPEAVETAAAAALPSHARPALSNTYVAPRNEVEQALALVWQKLLGIDEIGVHDNFFDLGGHSLLATQLISQLRETFQIELPLRAFFEAATIAQLGVVVEEILVAEMEALSEEEAQRALQE